MICLDKNIDRRSLASGQICKFVDIINGYGVKIKLTGMYSYKYAIERQGLLK